MQVYPMLQLRVCVCVLGIAGLLVVTVFVTLWRSCWQQRIENWLDSKWEFDCRPLVKIKFRPEANYYGIHVRGLPLDAAVQDVERGEVVLGLGAAAGRRLVARRRAPALRDVGVRAVLGGRVDVGEVAHGGPQRRPRLRGCLHRP